MHYAKKNTIQYEERNEEKREEYIKELENLPEDSEIYYIDESGFEEYYEREYGYAPRGEKVIGKIKGRKFARTNIVKTDCVVDIIFLKSLRFKAI